MTRTKKDQIEEITDDIQTGKPTDEVPHFFSLADQGVSEEELDNAKPLEPAPRGEYTIMVKDFRSKDGKIMRFGKLDSEGNRHLFVLPEFVIVDHPDEATFKPFTYYLELPGKQVGTRKNNVMVKFKTFCRVFNIDPWDSIDWLDLKGQKVEAALSVEEDEEFGDKNRIDSFIGA